MWRQLLWLFADVEVRDSQKQSEFWIVSQR